MNPNKYAQQLLKTQGKQEALRIAEDSVKKAGQSALTLFDEAEWTINPTAATVFPTLSKRQSHKVEGKKDKREQSTIKFWQNVVAILKAK